MIERTSADHQRMMETPMDWPQWPVLPLKRWVDGDMETGVLIGNGEPVVILSNMFELAGRDWLEIPRKEYESFAAIVADGWLVD